MAKKKKHRKTRKQKLAKATKNKVHYSNNKYPNQGIGEESGQSVDNVDPRTAAVIREDKTQNQDIHHDDSAKYVKNDVKSALTLAGVIILAFVALYIVLTMTTFGSQIYSIIKL